MMLSTHHIEDSEYLAYFAIGFAMNVLRRMSFVIRSKNNPFKTRRAYLYTNWDILLYRLVFDSAVIFGTFRHMEYLPKQTPAIIMSVVMAFPQVGAAYLLLGMVADMIVETGASILSAKYPAIAPFAEERMTPPDGGDPAQEPAK